MIADEPVDDLDHDPPVDVLRASRTAPHRGPARRRALGLVVALVLVAGVGAAVARQHEQRAAAAAALRGEQPDPAQAPRGAAPTGRAVEAAALSALPDDLELTQRAVDEGLAGASPGLPPLAWSTAQTSITRDGGQRTADGGPVLVDAQRTAAPSADEGSDREDLVSWRVTTPLRPQAPLDPCSAEGPVTVPDGDDGLPAPDCVLKTTTSPSGEQQVVAVRSWQRFVETPGGARPARIRTVHLAVLVTNARWTWSVASSAVGAPGSRASVPLMSTDQVALATRWTADAGRGLPTPAPLDGTPLPGFSG